MANPLSTNSGKPSLDTLQYLQDNWGSSEITASLRCAKVTIVTGGNVGVEADIPVGAEIVGAQVICTRSNGSGTMQIKTGADSPVTISDAIACETADAIDYAASIDTTYSVVGSDGIKVFANAAGDAGNIYIFYIKSA